MLPAVGCTATGSTKDFLSSTTPNRCVWSNNPGGLPEVVFHQSYPFSKFIPIEKIGFLRYRKVEPRKGS
jgi:hypothetical protein